MDNIKTNIPGTIFLDIDGTIFKHKKKLYRIGSTDPKNIEVLPGVVEQIEKWKFANYTIIITTSRPKSMKRITKKQLEIGHIVYDKLIMGLPHGQRIVINDTKPDSGSQWDTAVGIMVTRDAGLNGIMKEY